MEYQWPVALRPSSSPAAASVREPSQTETIVAPFSVLRLDPGDDSRIVVRLHRGNDDVVGAVGVRRVELSRRRRWLYFDVARIEPDWIRPLRHHGHVRDTRFREHAIGTEKVGNFRALVERENCDGWPLALGRLQRRDRALVLGRRDDGKQRGRFEICAHCVTSLVAAPTMHQKGKPPQRGSATVFGARGYMCHRSGTWIIENSAPAFRGTNHFLPD